MPLELQPKLLRVLQQSEVTPVGASAPVPIDVQVVAATNRNLAQEVAEGRFREDLYFRLNMVELKVPALRERPQDVPLFIAYFAQRFAERYGRPVWKPDTQQLASFCEYHWPGNIRQLSHVIEQSYVLDCAPELPHTGTPPQGNAQLPCLNLDKLRNVAVQQALQATKGHKGRAARLLGVHANTMTRLVSQLESGAVALSHS
jgi:DNA-binding NtrC family response regulator